MRKDFLERCVSPEYDRINRVQLNADLKLRNFKQVMLEEQEKVKNNRARMRGKGKKGAKPGQQQATGWEHILAAQNAGAGPQMQPQTYGKPAAQVEDSSDGRELDAGPQSSDNEELNDYQVDGYHVVHIK